MGNRVGSPPVSGPTDVEEEHTKLGDLLAGRLSDVDSVEAVRELRERR